MARRSEPCRAISNWTRGSRGMPARDWNSLLLDRTCYTAGMLNTDFRMPRVLRSNAACMESLHGDIEWGSAPGYRCQPDFSRLHAWPSRHGGADGESGTSGIPIQLLPVC